MKEFIISEKDSKQRVDKYLQRLLPNTTKSFLYKMMRKKNIVLNDHKIQGNELLNENDIIKIWFSDDTFDNLSGQNSSLDIDTSEFENAYKKIKGIEIIYEDDDYIVLDKPIGVLSQKADRKDVSLNEWIIGYLLSNNKLDVRDLNNCKPAVVNRLDRNTCGLVLGGKTTYGLNRLSKSIKDRSIKKIYHAIVLGKPDNEQLLVDYHTKNTATNEVKVISQNQYNRLNASEKDNYTIIKTLYKPVKSSLNSNIDSYVSLLEVELLTGKTHQIRAHMAYAGYPLLGDNKYGNSYVNKKLHLNHQLLQAYQLTFPACEDLGSISGKTFISECKFQSIEEI